MSVDRFAEKYPSYSSNHYAANNPIYFVDVMGDSIVGITRTNNSISIENSPAEEGGKNFTNTISFESGISTDDVSDYSAGVVNDAMIAIGDNAVTVSSGSMTPEKQAAVMFKNIQSGSLEGERGTYNTPAGNAVLDVYANMNPSVGPPAPAQTVKGAMTTAINEGVKNGAFQHIVGASAGKNVFDIAPSTVSKPDKMHTALEKGGAKVFSPVNKPKERAIHVEIKQPKTN